MSFSNASPFPALAYGIVDPGGAAFEVVAARGTFVLVPAAGAGGPTHAAAALADQPELRFSDAYHGELNRSSVAEESDLAQHKPRCDVIVIGSAHTPTGEPVPRIEVGIEITREAAPPGVEALGTLLSHRLVASGPRAFERGASGARLGDPEPFTELPIRYEHAFGGELRVEADDEAAARVPAAHRLGEEARARHPDGPRAPAAHSACTHNPLGLGWLEGWYAEARGVERWPAPRIEARGAEMTAEHFERLLRGELRAGEIPALVPRGFGVVAKPWQPRIARAGTLDARWQAERWPLMPDDFDMAYWNGAHPDMQCAHLFGGEQVTLWNLLPPGAPGAARGEGGRVECRFALPATRLALHLADDQDREAWIGARVDTMIVDLDRMRLSLVWRAVVPAAGVVAATLCALDDAASGPRDAR